MKFYLPGDLSNGIAASGLSARRLGQRQLRTLYVCHRYLAIFLRIKAVALNLS